jgi:hypothetical protein
MRTKAARAALVRAGHAARHAGIAALTAEVESVSAVLSTPAVAGRDRAASRLASGAGRHRRDATGLRADSAPWKRSRRAGTADRRRTCGGARLARFARRRCAVVELDPGAGAWSQSAHRAAGAQFARAGRQGAVVRSRTGAPVDDRIQKIDPETGAILRTIECNRFVTGVTWVDGELWHGSWEGDESDFRQIDPRNGEVLEILDLPPGVGVSGLESDGGDQFFCGGGNSGKVRAVRRPGSAAA